MKICYKCKKHLNIDNFVKDKSTKDGLTRRCKDCAHIWYEKNKDKVKVNNKKYREENGDKLKEYNRQYYIDNKATLQEYNKQYNKQYFQKNKRKISEQNKAKRKTNMQYKAACNLRERLNKAVSGNYKVGSAINDLGCSIEYFVNNYIPSLFKLGMSWGNHGKTGWHLDHIIPLASFDLTDREQLLKACHYTNIQPLWWQDNLDKRYK